MCIKLDHADGLCHFAHCEASEVTPRSSRESKDVTYEYSYPVGAEMIDCENVVVYYTHVFT